MIFSINILSGVVQREYLTDIAFIILFSLGAGILFSVLNPLRATLLLSGSLFCISG